MNILFLDVASGSGLLACSTEERIVALRAIDHRLGDHDLVPLIEEVVKASGLALPLLTHLACVIGPGGFTSLRIGVSCINALSWALKVPVSGIHLSELYAARVQDANFVWLHSTKRTELFVRGFGDLATEWPDSTHITIGDFLSKLPSPETYPSATSSPQCRAFGVETGPKGNLKPITYTGELLPEHCAAIGKTGAEALSLRPMSDTLPRFLASRAYREQVLQPWYGRGW